jgi:acetyl-CoA synthetase
MNKDLISSEEIDKYVSNEYITPPMMRYKKVSYTEYQKIYRESIDNYVSFWRREAEKLIWNKRWSIDIIGEGVYTRWFIDGEIDVYHNLIGKFKGSWAENKPALIWENEEGETRIILYSDLLKRSLVIASSLSDYDVKYGDWAIIYTPPSIEAFEIFLGLIRRGVAIEFVFTGFGYEELRKRIVNRKARHIVVQDGFIRKGRAINLLRNIAEIINKIDFVKNIFVIKRIDVSKSIDKTVLYEDLLRGSEKNSKPAIIRSIDPLIGFHSGYEDDFKKLTHSAGGYLTQVYSTSRWIGLRPRDIYFCTVWPGWVTGVSYLFFGPLMIGSTVILYEGGPDHPSWNRWWEIIERYSATIFLTTGSALRMLRRYTPQPIKDYNLDTLKAILITAEPLEKDVWNWVYRYVGTGHSPFIDSVPREFSGRIPVVNLYIQSEIGTFATGNLINYVFTELSPGSAGPPIPGFDIDVYDDNDNPVRNKIGRLIIRRPWPSIPIEASEDFIMKWSRGYYDTGDYAIMNERGYITPLGRHDNVLKISGYRISPGSIKKILEEYTKDVVIERVKDDLRFESYKLVISKRSGLEESFIRKIVRERLGAIAEPREIIFID